VGRARRSGPARCAGRWWALLGLFPLGGHVAALLLRTARSSRCTPRPGAGAVVVLGSGLDGGAVSPVLARRLDRAAAIHRAGSATGRPPLLVRPGGAKAAGGPTEAAAMAAYLIGLGVPAQDLLLEDRSTTTQENLRASAALLAQRAVPPPVVVVTSDFHAWRAAALARRQGLRVQVVGAATPASLRLPALLRELRLMLGLQAWSTAAGAAALVASVAPWPREWLRRDAGRRRRWRAGQR
jgi:uncharacterized SAM-binding protein YcdF (DUF218 family)